MTSGWPGPPPREICIVMMSAIGDAVHVLPVANALKRAWPETRITWVLQAVPFRLMKGHAAVGRRWAGKIRQLITGSIGLDESEWGVTLFAKDTYDIKNIVYEMRFDEVTVKYGEFGDFFIGIQLPLDQLFRRLGL